MLAPVAVTLQNQLRATVYSEASGASETPHEAAFRARFLPQLQAALDGLQRPSEADVSSPNNIWATLKRLRDALAVELRCETALMPSWLRNDKGTVRGIQRLPHLNDWVGNSQKTGSDLCWFLWARRYDAFGKI